MALDYWLALTRYAIDVRAVQDTIEAVADGED